MIRGWVVLGRAAWRTYRDMYRLNERMDPTTGWCRLPRAPGRVAKGHGPTGMPVATRPTPLRAARSKAGDGAR